MTASELPVSL